VMPLTLSGPSLPTGTIGRSYKSALGASGGQAPYTWKVVAGTPPAIIGVDTTGTVSGTPTETGSYGFTVQASDASGQQVKSPASIAITGLLGITTASLPSGKVGTLYSANVGASGGLAPYSWNLIGGAPPPGLLLTTLGGISGTPITAGSFNFTLQVLDSGGGSSSQTYTVSIAAATAPVSVTTTSLPNGTVGTAYSSSVSATGGTSPYTWTLSAGGLPAGLTLSGGGAISGTPTLAGASTFTLKVTDSAGGTSSQAYSVTVNPTISITPTSVTLSNLQTQQFTATMTGSNTTAFAWSLSAMMGTLTASGLYAAPAPIPSPQTITVKAANVSDPTQFATATVSLVPDTIPPTVALTSPSNGATVGGIVTVTASANDNIRVAGVRFLVDGVALGSELTTGPYAAVWDTSAFSNGTHTLTAVARDAGGNTATGTATVTVSNVVTKVTLPVEVVGGAGTTQTVTVNVSSVVSGTQLWLQIHNLKYETEASVQINNGSWIPINTANSTLLGLAAAYGGIGGGFSTLKLTLSVPDGLLVAGSNTVSFRFNNTDGVTSGFRVLDFNFLAPDGTQLVNASTFVQDDPNAWQPPSTLATDIAAGKLLWQTASLTAPGVGAIQAKCGMCHAQDGRDLKYFNYSNSTIRARSIFHGLTAQQGDQIASYIRSLSVSNPGRPWNPPYQPGPGLDSQPVEQWAAGAGLDAVLNSDQEMLNEIFPAGIQPATFSANGNLNARETRIPVQLRDWNGWLPTVAPVDAWGDAFLNSAFYQMYQNLRIQLVPGDPVAYANAVGTFGSWGAGFQQFITPLAPNVGADASFWTPQYVAKVYSTPQWAIVKSWEINQEFGLEGLARSVFLNPQADSRAWLNNFLFFTSPNMLHIPRGFPGIGNGLVSTFVYDSFIWYHAQLILNNSNKAQIGTSPIDWGYVYGFIHEMGLNDSPGQTGMNYLWQIKALQISNNGIGPDKTDGTGWSWLVNDPTHQVAQEPKAESIWPATSPATRTALYEGSIRAFLDVVETFTPQQFYTGGSADPNALPVPGSMYGRFEDRIWYAIPVFRYFGVNQTLINEFASWAKTLWPLANWSLTTSDTCWQGNSGIVCGTSQ